MSIDDDEVRRVADLANLRIDADCVRSLGEELKSILDYVELLDELDLSAVPATAGGPPLEQKLRDDVVEPGLSADEALENAPDGAGGHFRVPRVIDG